MEKDAAFERRFQQVAVNEPTVEATISILRGLKDKYENFHGVTISDTALVPTLRHSLSVSSLTPRLLPPDCPIDTLLSDSSPIKPLIASTKLVRAFAYSSIANLKVPFIL